MHLWKKIGVVGVALALMLTTVACGSSDSGSDEGKGEQVTIVYARGSGQGPKGPRAENVRPA